MTVIERLNARALEPADLPFVPALATVDVSFISLTKVLPAVARCLAPGGELLAMVKPQFELGRERVGRGVVRDPADRREAILAVARAARDLGLPIRGFASSGLPGPKGNRETFVWCGGEGEEVGDLEAAILAVEHGMKTAALITHSHPPAATEAVAVAVAIAREAGWRLTATAEELAKHGAAAEGVEEVAELSERPDLCLVLGGDGSILHALRRFARSGVPVFGVNFGTVGFLAAVERDQAEEGIRRAFAGDTETVELPGLEVEVDGEARVALNDVTFARRPRDRVAELSYRIAGEEVGHVRCDGLVAATPVGSTGYNLANQGPILAWGVEGYVVSYIAPHSLTARALVVAPGDVLHVGNAAGREAVDVAVDGAQVGELAPGAALEVRFANGVGRLAQLPGTSFYQRIREKFGHLAV